MKEEKCVLYMCSRVTYDTDNLFAFLLVVHLCCPSARKR